jgi:ABC-type nickel/cobalt efflux system permease component RcnA
MGYAVLLALGPRLLGAWAGGVILVASFAVGFAWLVLLVAPWAARGRNRSLGR